MIPDEIAAHRVPDHSINPLFLMRWSPRSMSGDPIEESVLMSLFEAARWAPSSYNGQPWRFFYALRGDAYWESYLSLLVPANQAWAHKAGALVIIASKTHFDNGKLARTHSLDTGSAWMSMALEATFRRLAIHGMAGFDADKAREIAHIPGDWAVEMMVAVGHRAPKEFLPENLAKTERPSGRLPVSELAFAGKKKTDL